MTKSKKIISIISILFSISSLCFSEDQPKPEEKKEKALLELRANDRDISGLNEDEYMVKSIILSLSDAFNSIVKFEISFIISMILSAHTAHRYIRIYYSINALIYQ